MKSFLTLLFLAPFFMLAQQEKPAKLNEKSAEVIFLRKVELAVRAHDADQLMSYVEPSYKRTQHDEFLEGRTLQFFTEFFCSTIPFNEISTAQLINYTKSKTEKNQWDVVFFIANSKEECYSTFFLFRHPSTNVLSIFSAVG
jgi:hypothetical protein